MEVDLYYECSNVGSKCCHWTDWCREIWGTFVFILMQAILMWL